MTENSEAVIDLSNNYEELRAPVRALCGWFEVRFCGGGDGGDAACVELSTSPLAPSTHWGQTVLPLRTPLRSPPLLLELSQSRKSRHDLNLSLAYNGAGTRAACPRCPASASGTPGCPPS